MSREVDTRVIAAQQPAADRLEGLREAALEASRRLPGEHTVRVGGVDAVTGNPDVLLSEAAPPEQGDYVERALEHLGQVSGALGLTPAQASEFAPDPVVQETSGGAVAVHLTQQYRGIPIFAAAQTVRFGVDGRIEETVGRTVSIGAAQSATPALSVVDAVRRAAEHVARPTADEQQRTDQFGEPFAPAGVDLDGFEPTVVAMFSDRPDMPTVLAAGPFGDELKAGLIWFPIAEGDLRLGWEVLVTMPDYAEQFRVIVDATSGDILYAKQLVPTAIARGSVYKRDGGSARETVAFPVGTSALGVPVPPDLPNGWPDQWVAGDAAEGNAVFAHLGDSGPTIRGVAANGTVVFEPPDATGDEQKVLNIFYFNCVMHDFFYLLGFRERDGNFQRDNLGRGGIASDRVDARAYSGPVSGTASMGTPIDGSSPVMKMGLVQSTNRHTAFDSSVVFHEFMHGVTNRLVGGPHNSRALDEPQSGGMGEGWGDYIACTINDSTVVGSWVVNRPLGIRRHAYDDNFPGTFGDVGSPAYSEVHDIGEIWAAVLLALNRRLGKTLVLQIVVDALKLSPANPNFLQMRDAILAALQAKGRSGQLSESDVRRQTAAAWEVFARFEMGVGARCIGASLTGVVGDATTPLSAPDGGLRVEAAPNSAIPDANPAGIQSALNIDRPGSIAELAVEIDIRHTYRGDLRVTLVAPDGRMVILHDRQGAGTDDLVRTFTAADVPGLGQLAGAPARGTWRLIVVDLAKRDIGTLRRWALEIELADDGPQLVTGAAQPALSIPDADPTGVSSFIGLTEGGTSKELAVAVDITHPFVGDLRVELVAPSGRHVLLADREGGSSDNLIARFDSDAHAGLRSLVGEDVRGNWVMRVSDLAGRDIGKFNSWRLEATV
jgi:extracellular elastinolytic metalloproteinase